MRLLMTTDTVGGVWSFTRDLTVELLDQGHAVSLVSFGPRPSAAQDAWITGCDLPPERFQFTAAGVPLEWEQENARAFLDGDVALQSAAARFQPDLLLSNQFCFGATTLRIPRVVAAHSDVLSWARAVKPAALAPSPWINHYTSLAQGGLLQANAVVTPTRWMLGALARNFFLPRGGSVIPNGCAVTPAADLPERKLQAVSAGRLWDEAKGMDLLQRTELGLPVMVAGETRSGSDVPEGSVKLLGPLAPEALYALFRESSLYVCTSLYEPFGLAPIEAALCGCAVVARDLPSLREVWGDDALYFTDAATLQAAVRRLAEDPAALAEAAIRAGQRAAQYTVARMADAYLHLFESLLAQRKATPHVA